MIVSVPESPLQTLADDVLARADVIAEDEWRRYGIQYGPWCVYSQDDLRYAQSCHDALTTGIVSRFSDEELAQVAEIEAMLASASQPALLLNAIRIEQRRRGLR